MGVQSTGVMKVQDVSAQVDVEEAQVDGDKVAGGSEAAAGERGELLAVGERESHPLP